MLSGLQVFYIFDVNIACAILNGYCSIKSNEKSNFDLFIDAIILT